MLPVIMRCDVRGIMWLCDVRCRKEDPSRAKGGSSLLASEIGKMFLIQRGVKLENDRSGQGHAAKRSRQIA